MKERKQQTKKTFSIIRCAWQSTCFIVMAGLQSLSSSRIDRHTVPDGYTFGWKSGGSNLPKR